MTATIENVKSAMVGLDRIPLDKVGKLIGILEASDSDGLLLLYRHRVKDLFGEML